MNPLIEKPRLRQRIYTVFWIIGLCLGASQVGYASVDAGSPQWLTAALAVFAFVGTGIGYTASMNVYAEES